MQYFSSLLMIFATLSMVFFGYAAQQHFMYYETHWLSIILGSIFLIAGVIIEARKQKAIAAEEAEWRKKRSED